MKTLVVLTQYKRNHLETQLIQIEKQTLTPDYVVVFQNENHVDITELKNRYNFIHVKSDYNTKYFGRFAFCFSFEVDICLILDDDIIPGTNCFKNYCEQCNSLNAIIGGNGRIAQTNPNSNKLKRPSDVGFRSEPIKVDFVGHIWCFKKEWLHYMFSIQPYTYDTGEDMHLCFSSKVLGNIHSYTGKQETADDQCDIQLNRLATDQYSSYLTTSSQLRKNVEEYFTKNYDLKLIDKN